jgi:putative tryptophan/tyrosine transport system substrate-binding protein
MKWSILVALVLLVRGVAVEAQEAKIPRIGFLIASKAVTQEARLEAFKGGLRALGYVEGQNIVLEIRSGEGKPDLLPSAAAQLVKSKVNVIVSGGPSSTLAARRATKSIPIIMTLESDPVGDGLVENLARPGSNITGLSTFTPELSGKRLELLKEMVPNLTRVAVLSSRLQSSPQREELEAAAKGLNLRLQALELQGSNDIEPAFHKATKERAGAVLAQGASILLSHRSRVADLAVKNRLPVNYPREEFTKAGGLSVYAASTSDLARRAAIYVDKILKGADPAELPVEQPMKFDFIINLKAASQIGLTMPPNVLVRATKVIK